MKINVAYKAFRSNDTFEFPSDLIPSGITLLDTLDFVFRQCNHVDGTEWIANKRLRSMSVEDEVSIDGNTFICANVGWVKKP
jgi:hypothetical protein